MKPEDVVVDQDLLIQDDFWERNMRKHKMEFRSRHPGAEFITVESVRMLAKGLVVTMRWRVPR